MINKFINRNRDASSIILIVILGAGLWTLHYYLKCSGFDHYTADAESYADIARNLLNGNGFISHQLVPLEVSLLKKSPIIPFVSGHWPLLHPLLMMFCFAIFGFNFFVISLTSGFAYILAAVSVYILANALIGRKGALIAAMLFLVNSQMLYYSSSGLTEPLFMAMLMMTFYFIIKGGSVRNYVFAGFFFGLTQLTRMVGMVYAFPILLYIVWKEKSMRIMKSFVFMTLFIIVSSPLFYIIGSNYGSITGGIAKYYALCNMPEFPRQSGFMILEGYLDPIEYIMERKIDFINRVKNNFLLFYNNFLKGNIIFIPYIILAIMSFFLPSSEELKKFKIFVFLLMCIQITLSSLLYPTIRYLHIFYPFLIILSVFTYLYLEEKLIGYLSLTRKKHLSLIFLALMVVWTQPFSLNDSFAEMAKTRSIKENRANRLGKFLKAHLNENDVIVTDIPSLTGLTGEVFSIWLTYKPEMVNQINEEIVKVNAIFLSNTYTFRPYMHDKWRQMLKKPEPWGNFKPVSIFRDGDFAGILYVNNQPTSE